MAKIVLTQGYMANIKSQLPGSPDDFLITTQSALQQNLHRIAMGPCRVPQESTLPPAFKTVSQQDRRAEWRQCAASSLKIVAFPPLHVQFVTNKIWLVRRDILQHECK